MKAPAQRPSFLDSRLGEDLLWRDWRVDRFSTPAPALFLDRDGVMIEEKEYIRDPKCVELLQGIPELIREASKQGFAVVEITNQAGIARGYLDWPDFVGVEDRLTRLLAEQQVSVDAVLACPFHPEGLYPYRKADHPWRKPNPGMLLEAARWLNLALPQSLIVGDKDSDQQAGRAAKLAFGIHLLTGHGREHEPAARAVSAANYPVHVLDNAAGGLSLLRAFRPVSANHQRHGSD